VSFDMTGGKLGRDDLPRLVAAFHQMHERIYTIKDEADIVEFTTWKVRAIGDTGGRSRRGKALPPQQGQAKPKSRRAVFLGSSGRQEVPVYDGTVLGTGAVVDGPALIEQPTTTLLLLAKQQARTDDHGNFLVEQR
jgi:N-methylhydantoinase A